MMSIRRPAWIIIGSDEPADDPYEEEETEEEMEEEEEAVPVSE